MTQPLIADSDTDLAAWQAFDQSTFLEMACAEVRKFCGWHIAPTLTVSAARCWFGERGLIVLPSTYVTAVSSVSVDGVVQVADTDFFWDSPKPWIRRAGGIVASHDHFALVDFTHGYTDTPPDVKAVVFEVMSTAMELPASNADKVQTTQYTFELRRNTGIALSPDQKNRLSPYRITRFGGTATAR